VTCAFHCCLLVLFIIFITCGISGDVVSKESVENAVIVVSLVVLGVGGLGRDPWNDSFDWKCLVGGCDSNFKKSEFDFSNGGRVRIEQSCFTPFGYSFRRRHADSVVYLPHSSYTTQSQDALDVAPNQ
jgi:hypothetical protein